VQGTTDRIMRFDVLILNPYNPYHNDHKINLNYNYPITIFDNVYEVRHVILVEADDVYGNPTGSYIGGYDMTVPMKPFKLGKVYELHIIDTTPDAHPIHIHLVNMQVIKIIQFDAESYENDWITLNGIFPLPRDQ
jgi:spore coat protein A